MPRPVPNPSDGAEASLVAVKNETNREMRWLALRDQVKGRLSACPDCRFALQSMVLMMDIIAEPAPEDAPPPPTQDETIESTNATVRIVPPSPSVSAAGQGEEVAPGVVIIPAPKP